MIMMTLEWIGKMIWICLPTLEHGNEGESAYFWLLIWTVTSNTLLDSGDFFYHGNTCI